MFNPLPDQNDDTYNIVTKWLNNVIRPKKTGVRIPLKRIAATTTMTDKMLNATIEIARMSFKRPKETEGKVVGKVGENYFLDREALIEKLSNKHPELKDEMFNPLPDQNDDTYNIVTKWLNNVIRPKKTGVRIPLKRIAATTTKTDNGFEFLIGKHSGYHKWVLPKGLVEKGESDQEAAVREVVEEVGVEAEIVGVTPLKTIEYWYYADFGVHKGKSATGEESERRVKKYQENGAGKTRVHKFVIFYLMEMKNDLGTAGWEMEGREWVSYEQGMKTLEFQTEKDVFEIAGSVLQISAN